jgi:hypothetical protein
VRATVGNTRDHRANDPVYIEWQKQYQAEQAAAQAADPETQFRRMADAQAHATRELILTGYITDELLPGVTRINGRKVLEEPAIRNFKWFADNTPTFKKYMCDVFLSAAERSDLAPIAPNYTALHNLMLAYAAYPDEPVEVVPVVVGTRTPSEIAAEKYKARMTEIVVHDPIDNKGYTEFDLERCDSAKERRLRRLMEGKIGNNRYDEYLEIKDIQQQQESDRVRRAERGEEN